MPGSTVEELETNLRRQALSFDQVTNALPT